MQRKSSDNVFLLTLVDFLVQVIFFGLFVFVVYQVTRKANAEAYDRKQVDQAIEMAGVSNLTELTDELSRLAPVRLKGLSQALGKDPSAKDVEAMIAAIDQSGGAKGTSDALSRLAKLEKGSGKPACLLESSGGERRARTLASAVGSGNSISFTGPTPQLITLLSEVGLSYSQVQSLGFRQFTQTFSRVLKKYPDCRYTIEFRETTRMVDARDAAGQIFYLRIRH